MTISLKHAFVNPVADDGDSDLTGPDEWNAEHVLTQATDRLLGRVSVGAGATEELTAAQAKTLLALENVDNTSDANKPVSTATQTALDLKANLAGGNTFTGGTQTITPTAASLTKALSVTQSGPVTASATGPQSYNLVTVTETGETTLTSGRDSYDLFNGLSSALRVNHTVGGILPAIRIAGTFASNYTGSSATMETVGVIGSTYSNATVGALWGNIGYSSVGPTGATAALIPIAAEVSAETGSTVTRRTGFVAISEAPVQGSTLDAAIVVSSQSVGKGTPGGWKNVIAISNSWWSQTALDSTANFFSADSATLITNWAKMDNVTVAGNIMLFPNLNIPGAAAGFTLPAHVSGAFQYGATNSTAVRMEVNAFTGPAVFTGTRANTSSTAPSAVLANEAIVGISSNPYNSGGTYSENGAIVVKAAENQTGSARGSYTAVFNTPIGSTTEAEVARFGPTKTLLVGTTTGGADGVVNVATGFRIGDAATSGNVLRGDGTNFVSSPLGSADVTGGYATTVTAGGTTTLTVSSARNQFFTGTLSQTVTLPVASTLALGHQFWFENNSTGVVTVQSSGGNTVAVIPSVGSGYVTCILASGTSAASWHLTANYVDVYGGKLLTVQNTLAFVGTDGTSMTFPATSASIARTDAAQTFTGVQTLSSQPILSSLTASSAVATDGSKGLVSVTNTGTGSNVLATSPTITTPNTVGTTTNDNAAAGSVGEYFSTGTGDNNASATVTMTIASPCVVTWTAHKFTVGAATTAVRFTTTGALPTGVTSGTTYYIKAIDADTFNIATSADNALAGTFINTSGSQSGVHTADIRVTMATATNQNLAAFQLGAGDWTVGGQVLMFAIDTSTLVTNVQANLSTTSAGTDRTWGRRLSIQISNNTQVMSNNEFTVFNVGPARFSLSALTTIYVVGQGVFTTSGMRSAGWAQARRVR